MISMNEAVQIVMDSVSQLKPTSVPLLESLGHTLAKDVVSDINMPPFEKAMMDGYAVVGADVAEASKESPVTLKVIEEIRYRDSHYDRRTDARWRRYGCYGRGYRI